MADEVQNRYEETPYRQGVHTLTHPARIGAVARLLGVPSAAPERARVLELGCGQGYNLLPLAEAFPHARFVGVDFSAPQIAEGRAVAAAVGLKNVELVHADLRGFDPEPGVFDYVIAHGLFSWVPDDVKDRTLALCARALGPRGVAYISYNTLPGWKQQEVVRDLMMLHAARVGATGEAATRAAATAALTMLDRALGACGDTGVLVPPSARPYVVHLHHVVTELRNKDPLVVYHDEMGPVNDPCYLMQLVDWAGEHGLTYLGDAHPPTQVGDDLPEAVRTAVAEGGYDRLTTEQMFDFIVGRQFRRTLLCRPEAVAPEPRRGGAPDLSSLHGCAFGLYLRPVGASHRDWSTALHADDRAVVFAEPSGRPVIETATPWVKATLLTLAAGAPRRLPWAELLGLVRKGLGGVEGPPEAEMLALLYDLWGKEHADILLDSGMDCAPALDIPRRPRVTPLGRHLAAYGLPVTNLWHEGVRPGERGRALIARCDGSELAGAGAPAEEMVQLAEAGMLLPE